MGRVSPREEHIFKFTAELSVDSREVERTGENQLRDTEARRRVHHWTWLFWRTPRLVWTNNDICSDCILITGPGSTSTAATSMSSQALSHSVRKSRWMFPPRMFRSVESSQLRSKIHVQYKFYVVSPTSVSTCSHQEVLSQRLN